MKKNVDILINDMKIEVHFNKELTNHKILLKFEIINPYQLICTDFEIHSKNKSELSSTQLRNINTHTLIKRSIKAIESYKKIDPKDFKIKTKGMYEDNIQYSKYIKLIKDRKISDRKILLSLYAYFYQKESRNYGENTSKRLSHLLKYSESYIKNLTKEIFNNDYIKNSTKGISGGILTKKTLKYLNSL
tara:strand:+ start:14953 stop:15519 length:567 start_codon:yes stop_codon:yes gene_type:complete